MPRGQQKHWQLLLKVPKGRTTKPVPIDRCIKYDNGTFQVYRYADGASTYAGSFTTIDAAVRARDGEATPLAVVASRAKLNAYFDSFYLPVIEPERKASTVRALRARYNVWVRDSLGDRCLGDIEVSDITWFAMSVNRRKDEVSGQTRREVIALVKAIFAHAVVNKQLAASPAATLALPSRDASKVTPPTFAVARAIVDAITHPVARMAAETMLYTGLRVGECLALTWEHVDLAARTISVRQSIDHCTGEVGTPKTKRAVREVPIPKLLLAALKTYRAAQRAGSIDCREPWVFPSDATARKRPTLSYEDLTRLHWNVARKAVAKTHVTLHMLRHLYASRLIQTGTPLTTVADLLGHFSSSFTLSQYGHCLDSKDDLAARVDQAFAAPSARARPRYRKPR